MNERTATGSAFAIAKEAINDPVWSLTKIIDFQGLGFHKIFETYWKIRGPSSMLAQPTIKCVILTPLVKCAQNNPKMTHIIVTQARMLNGPRSLQNNIKFEIFKKSNTVPLQLLKSLCIPQQLMKSLSIPLLTLEIMTTTIGTVQPAADCCKLHQVEYRLPFDRAEPTKS